MENFIQKELKQGLTPYLSTAEGLGARIGMDVEILSLAAGKSLMLLDAQKETAVLVIEGTGTMSANGTAWQYSRRNQFLDSCYCLHVCTGVQIEITADTDTLCYVQKAVNERCFDAVFYTPEQVDTVIAGSHGELDGTMRLRHPHDVRLQQLPRTPTWCWARSSTLPGFGAVIRRTIIRSRRCIFTALTSRRASARASPTARSTSPGRTVCS